LDQVERFDERRHFGAGEFVVKPRAHIELPQLGQRQAIDEQLRLAQHVFGVRGAIEKLVVNHDRHTVGRMVIVELDEIGFRVERRLKRRQRVLRRFARIAAMSNYQHMRRGDELTCGCQIGTDHGQHQTEGPRKTRNTRKQSKTPA